jgi:hypothetical protein
MMIPFEAPWGNYMLKEFIETQQPEMVSLFPQTTGWLIIGLILLIALFNKIIFAIKLYQSNAYRREALKWLEELPDHTNVLQQPVFRKIPTLLRKVALTGFGASTVVPLSLTEWEVWLDQQCDKTSFSGNFSSYLQQLSYSPAPALNQKQMALLTEQVTLWIHFHRRPDD